MSKSISLLLLPATVTGLTVESLCIAYEAAVTAAISSIKMCPFETELLVAIDWNFLYRPVYSSNTELFENAQKLVGCAYSLIYKVSVKLGLDGGSADGNEIDFRIVLMNCNETSLHCHSQTLKWPLGPIFSLESLAATQYSWNSIFSTEDQDGKTLLEQYRHVESLIHASSQPEPRMSVIQKDAHHDSDANGQQLKKHASIAVGGSFDHLHIGHKYLLTATFLLLQLSDASSYAKLTIGITGDKLLANKSYSELIQSWEERYEGVLDFVLSLLPLSHTARRNAIMAAEKTDTDARRRIVSISFHDKQLSIECVELQDSSGPVVTNESITALVLTSETRSGGIEIMRKRAEKGLQPLKIHEIDVLETHEADRGPSTEEFAHKISSSRIRKRLAESSGLRSVNPASSEP
ncbi:hypothetical protein BGHDH14_bgh00288 [Blumeria hordei DH14]|uniref:Pantetheine-phosphate adenylyltransferase family protein n=1 Tax=Blumeria graminis f. sp. hordei (strain DH14) TaxID=546991 RepID=N1JIN4_BLUG1|nr:hypothetical protein BGHDH14_bgh00288 [Blumeria hordei DH14]